MISRKLALLAASATLLVATPALAVNTTFAQFTQTNSDLVVDYTTTGTSNVMSIVDAPVFFVIQAFGPTGIYSAFLNVTAASSTPVTDTGPQFEQVDWVGSYSFTNGTINYLTVNFFNAIVNVTGTGGSGSMFSTNELGLLNYTSDVIDVSGFRSENFALAFSAITPPFGIGADGYGTPFQANVAGTFSAAVPEPSTWGLLLIGFAATGIAVRRRHLLPSVTA